MIRCGKPILALTYDSLRILAYILIAIAIWNISYSIYLLDYAITTKRDVGYFINMISAKNDGNFLPFLLIFPAILAIAINIPLFYLLYKAFSKNPSPVLNKLIYAFVLISIVSVFIMIIICVIVLIRLNASPRDFMPNGISNAMQHYRTDSLIKCHIDSLQIQFQCCGSAAYREWYDIEWYDTNLISKTCSITYKYQAPFSCCSIKSIYPCIHHNIESTDMPYRYTKSVNFSLSLIGCYPVVLKMRTKIGVRIAVRIAILIITQCTMIVFLRFLQTAQFMNAMLCNRKSTYVSWLFGYYVEANSIGRPPPVPPIPKELMQ